MRDQLSLLSALVVLVLVVLAAIAALFIATRPARPGEPTYRVGDLPAGDTDPLWVEFHATDPNREGRR